MVTATVSTADALDLDHALSRGAAMLGRWDPRKTSTCAVPARWVIWPVAKVPLT